jgi:hypothetical protein
MEDFPNVYLSLQVIVCHSYEAADDVDDELSLEPGEILYVVASDNPEEQVSHICLQSLPNLSR